LRELLSKLPTPEKWFACAETQLDGVLLASIAERIKHSQQDPIAPRNISLSELQGVYAIGDGVNFSQRSRADTVLTESWQRLINGHSARLDAHVINYADDLVIFCQPGNGAAALATMRRLMDKLGLTVNDRKTRIACMPEESFDFLGYSVGRFYGKDGRAFIGTEPSRKSLKRIIDKIHDETTPRWNLESVEKRVSELNALLRGWSGYFNQGRVIRAYQIIQHYTDARLRRWLIRLQGERGTGYRQYPNEYLYGTLGLYQLPTSRAAVMKAKA
jgi:RNA-directed DNA polymerase